MAHRPLFTRPNALLCLAVIVWGLAGCNTPALRTDGLLARIATQHRVFVAVQDGPFAIELESGTVYGRAAGESHLDGYARMIHQELAIYPPGCLRHAGVHSIVLCEQLCFDDQRRAAIPVWELDTYCLDVSRGNESAGYPPHALHHDLYHIFDYFDDGQVYQDDAWAALNPVGFAYGDGGANAQDMEDAWQLRDDLPGFVTPYAMTGVEEDKAELFAHLITNYAQVMAICEYDPVLTAKVALLKQQLEAADIGLDVAFWEKLNAAQTR